VAVAEDEMNTKTTTLLQVIDCGDGRRLVMAENISDMAIAVSHAVRSILAADETPSELRAIAQRFADDFDRWLGVESPAATMLVRRPGGKVS
jgi:hypothetical protein